MYRKAIFPRTVQYLLAIAEHGSYTRAAEMLHVSQPTLSQQIKQLEETLHSLLIDRSGRNVRLTDAGEVFLHYARRAWGEMDAGTRAIHDVQNLSRGLLRLGWTPITDYLTYNLLVNFNYHYPGITLSTLEMPADEVEMAVAEGRIDIGIAFSKPITSAVHSSEVSTDILFEEMLCLAVGNAHPRAGQKERISAKEFGQESLVLLNHNFALRRHIDEYCLNFNITPNIVVETNSLNVIIGMIQAGSLATVLPKSIVRTQCGIYSIVPAPKFPNKVITMISHKTGYKSPACLAFTELALDWSAHRLQEIPIRKLRPCPLAEGYHADGNP